ncbi:uncharacterized protein LOC131679275 isoform X2 [Topomyia yanbarensis]|nr:uncharacterized protein LOC131679275 isoform X2 [Topomyia yanbarensis]XP_058815964.1 uncharacterized protein LOC131679275 isoform X2 [Topomyia yanbarensis]
MNEHPHIAKGSKFAENENFSKDDFNTLWFDISFKLNGLGPPIRTVAEWQKVWADLKLKTKKKLQHNKKECKTTGGGPNKQCPISPMEESIVNLLSLNKTVEHTGKYFGIQTSQIADHLLEDAEPTTTGQIQIHTELENSDLTNSNVSSDINNYATSKKSEASDSFRNYRKTLLTTQTNCLIDIRENAKECARYARKMYKLEEDKFKFKKKVLEAKEKRKSEQLQFQLQLLEYKKQKLALLTGTK